KRLVLNARSPQQSGEAITDAPRLVINSVLLIALLGKLLLYSPWSRPYRLIFDGHDVQERSLSGPRPAEFPVGSGYLLRLRREPGNPTIWRIYDQRGTHSDVLIGQEYRMIVCACDIKLGPALRRSLVAVKC